MNNSTLPYNNHLGRFPEKESPPGPYQESGPLPPFNEALVPTPVTTKPLNNMNLGINGGNIHGTTEQIQVQTMPQVRSFTIICSIRNLMNYMEKYQLSRAIHILSGMSCDKNQR